MKLSRIAVLVCLSLAVSSARAVNYVEVIATRVDDQPLSFTGFSASINVVLDDETGVTGVIVGTPAGAVSLFDDSGDGTEWDEEIHFATLTDLINASNGDWTIVINGSSSSTSTFSLNTSGLVDTDFFPTATNLSPAHGETGVPVNTSFSWSDPTGPITPDVLTVFVDSDMGDDQDAVSLLGDIAIGDTMWTPPINISAGPHEWAVGYYVLGDPQAVTSLNVTDGSIAWGISPFAPMDWPTAGPLVALGSETIAEFNNTVPEPAAVSLLSLGVLTLACRRRH